MSRKDRIIDEIKSITQKIKRNTDKGYSVENLQRALSRLEAEAREHSPIGGSSICKCS